MNRATPCQERWIRSEVSCSFGCLFYDLNGFELAEGDNLSELVLNPDSDGELLDNTNVQLLVNAMVAF